MTTVYLVRHAYSVGNVERVLLGCTDLGLAVEGIAQLPQLAERFRDVKLDAVYASPLYRAQKTAEAVNHYHKLPIITEDGVKEMFIGEWESQHFEKLKTDYPAEWAAWVGDDGGFRAPGGESLYEVQARMVEAIDRIAAENDGKTIAIVTHGCALRCFFCHAHGFTVDRIREVPLCQNTSVSRVVYDGGRIAVDYYGDAGHIVTRK